MGKLEYNSVNYGDHQIERSLCDFFLSFNNGDIDITESKLCLDGQTYQLNCDIHLMESDFFTVTWKAQLDDGTEFRIVRPNEKIRTLTGNTITFASLYHDGYAVSFFIQ